MLVTCCAYVYKQFEGYYLIPLILPSPSRIYSIINSAVWNIQFDFSFLGYNLKNFHNAFLFVSCISSQLLMTLLWEIFEVLKLRI